MQHITHEDTGFGVQALGESCVLWNCGGLPGLCHFWTDDESLRSSWASIPSGGCIRAARNQQPWTSQLRCNCWSLGPALFFQVQRVILYLQPDADLEAIDYRKLFQDVCELNWWHLNGDLTDTSVKIPGCRQIVTANHRQQALLPRVLTLFHDSCGSWPSWKGSCNLRLLLASMMSAHLDKARGFPLINFP